MISGLCFKKNADYRGSVPGAVIRTIFHAAVPLNLAGLAGRLDSTSKIKHRYPRPVIPSA